MVDILYRELKYIKSGIDMETTIIVTMREEKIEEIPFILITP
ncbi:hypothetical protein SacRon12I_07270 [Sulfolobus acidocaldarius Ron12/I]|uniref:Uncharacterized protein n=1 Tax=Sulfolobus acidocaldarius Ron12/I TaxID=1028567 RepID=M1J2M5_9CREN|nr:hypothetical protein SacRon12I_07270 [Sulfolobus acidocaldarius Ron12/I]